MLSDVERLYLIERLIAHVATLEKPRETLLSPFVGTTLPSLLSSGTPQVVVTDIVRLCLADAWNNDPPWLVTLIQLMPIDATDRKLTEIRDRVRVKPPQPADRLDTTVLDNGTPFVNRKVLRARLRRLATPAARTRPILVVTGAAQSGKSYSTEYIDHFSLHQPVAITTYRVALRPGTELETGPEDVAIELVSSMGRSLDRKPKPTTNQKLLAQQLASWVLNEAAQQSTQSWLVLDSFQGQRLRPDTRDLVIALADRVTSGVFAEKCRLILIGFDQSTLTIDPGRVDQEQISPILQAEIEVCVKEIASRAPAAVVVDPQPLVALVASKLPKGESRMRELNARLRALVLAIDVVGELSQSLPAFDYASVLGELLTGLPAGCEGLADLHNRIDELRASAAEITL